MIREIGTMQFTNTADSDPMQILLQNAGYLVKIDFFFNSDHKTTIVFLHVYQEEAGR